MRVNRVIGVERGDGLGDPRDPHVAVLCLEDGRRIPGFRAISNIKYGVEAYYTEVDGRSARVRVVGPCSRCGLDYLRAEAETTLKDTLMRLPGC
jgi:hypothetical protein